MRSSGARPVADEILDRIGTLARDLRLDRPGDGVIVAVSGGVDSLCLLEALVRLRHGRTRSLVVVHVDHGLRAESAGDASFVRSTAAALGVACDVIVVDTRAYARSHGLGLEHAGRALRYQALAAAAERHRARAVVTGHTRDDSVESLVMHLLRGAGLDGLVGIRPAETLKLAGLGPVVLAGVPRVVTVLRPLLGVGRVDTVAYCRERQLAWRVDPTNEDPTFLRNRVRHHLLPVLRTYNPEVDAALARTATLLRDEATWLDRSTARRWARLARPSPDGIDLRLAAWRRQPRAVQRRLLRRAVSILACNGEGLGFEAVERALTFTAADRARRLELPNRLALERRGEWLHLRREGTR